MTINNLTAQGIKPRRHTASKLSGFVLQNSVDFLNTKPNVINRMRALANPCTPVQFRYSPPIIFNGLAGLLGVATVFGLDAMLGKMKEGDASRSAEVMRLRPGGRAKDSMGYRYSFSSLPRLHCLREFPT